MQLIEIPPAGAKRLLPLLQDLHTLHATHQPDRHTAAPAEADLEAWLTDWLADDSVTAMAAESPQGSLLGYALYQIETRPMLPVRPAETRAMLHHIAVRKNWRRMGVGQALVAAVKARAVQVGATVVATTYAPFNTASAGLMRSMGLEPVLTLAEWRA